MCYVNAIQVLSLFIALHQEQEQQLDGEVKNGVVESNPLSHESVT